jgi:hypothetical protein
MMSLFMANILGEEPASLEDASYDDIDPSSELGKYVQLAYKYQIMGINADGTPIKNFDPNKIVSR